MVTMVFVVALVAILAFANGANDNSKGVATLVGFGSATARQALAWATFTTALGAAFSFWFAGGLIAAFKAKLFLAGTPLDSVFFAAVLIGAIGWVVFATWTGMPVSTTHAIIGGLIGAGLVAFGRNQIVWSFLGRSVAAPLIIGPLISTALVYVLAWPVVGIARRCGARCVCVTNEPAIMESAGGTTVAVTAVSATRLTAGTVAECEAAEAETAVTSSTAANVIHWASGGFIGFARGWNDAPKIAALSIVALTTAKVSNPAAFGFVIVTLAMAAGGYIAGRNVLQTLARKVTPLPLVESLTASIATAALVSAASWASMPVSTTHVSTGAIVGAGLKNDLSKVKWSKVGEIVLSWVITIPVAGGISAMVMWGVGMIARR